MLLYPYAAWDVFEILQRGCACSCSLMRCRMPSRIYTAVAHAYAFSCKFTCHTAVIWLLHILMHSYAFSDVIQTLSNSMLSHGGPCSAIQCRGQVAPRSLSVLTIGYSHPLQHKKASVHAMHLQSRMLGVHGAAFRRCWQDWHSETGMPQHELALAAARVDDILSNRMVASAVYLHQVPAKHFS